MTSENHKLTFAIVFIINGFSVQLIRRLDTRIPTPPISTYVTNTAPAPSLGKLADLRVVRGPNTSAVPPFGVGVGSNGVSGTVRSNSPSNSNSWRVSTPSSSERSTTVGGQRGWAGVVKPPSRGLTEGNQLLSMALRSEKLDLPVQAAGSGLNLAKFEISAQDPIPDDWEED